MALNRKFEGKTAILYARYREGGQEGLKGKEVERNRVIQKRSDMKTKEQKIGTKTVYSEIKEDEVVTEKIVSTVAKGDQVFRKDFVREALFDIYLDFLTVSGTIPNERVSLLVSENISISEIKTMESHWNSLSGQTPTTFYEEAKAKVGDSTGIVACKTELYGMIEAFQKSDATVENNLFGDLNQGQGSDNCSEQAASNTAFKNDVLLKEIGGVYVNKVGSVTDSQWETLVANMHGVEC